MGGKLQTILKVQPELSLHRQSKVQDAVMMKLEP